MTPTPLCSDDRIAASALATLIILQTVMLASLYTGVQPHPPATTRLFGIGPFIGASLSAATTALLLGPRSTRAGRGFGFMAAALALVSFGPQKYFDPQFATIWPAVVGGQIACAVLIWLFTRVCKAAAQPPETILESRE